MAKHKVDESTLPFATVAMLGKALREREISAKELANFFLKRLKRYGPKYNALACLTDKRAHNALENIDYDVKHGRARGPLQGIPYGAKDLLAVAGYPTTWGAAPYADQQFDYDATVISRLDSRQAVLIAKLAMIELAGGGDYNSAAASLQGPCRNPWNVAYWAGGSSSGSAAAVAAGLCPFALGSETSGSIMTPASYCGLTGLRPTYGLVSRHGAMALSWTCDKIGVIAHTAEDCGLVMHEIAGADDADPGSARKSFYFEPKYYRNTKELKIGYAEVDFAQWPEESLRPAYANALQQVKALGASMQESKLPDFPYGAVIGTIIDAEGASIFEPLIRSAAVDQLGDKTQIAGLKASLTLPSLDYLKAMRIRRQIQDAFRQLFTEVDLLIAPTRLGKIEPAEGQFPEEGPPPNPPPKGVARGLVPAGNLCGLPAVTVPCGYVNGLPIGLQIVGPMFQENRILGFASAFQDATEYHKQHPAVA